MTFEQFQQALKLLAEKKYPGDANGVKKITAKLTSGSSGPVVSGATVSGNCIIVHVHVCICVYLYYQYV